MIRIELSELQKDDEAEKSDRTGVAESGMTRGSQVGLKEADKIPFQVKLSKKNKKTVKAFFSLHKCKQFKYFIEIPTLKYKCYNSSFSNSCFKIQARDFTTTTIRSLTTTPPASTAAS